jgi:hypothetical protein
MAHVNALAGCESLRMLRHPPHAIRGWPTRPDGTGHDLQGARNMVKESFETCA